MGYDINFSGEIRIDPPIPADEVLGAGFPEPGVYGAKDVALQVDEVPVEAALAHYREAK